MSFSSLSCMKSLYYRLRPFIPRRLQLAVRRRVVLRKRAALYETWPILDRAGAALPHWKGWPAGKKFALVLTHDVDTERGQNRCYELINLEKSLGFRSGFNFVPRRYEVSEQLRRDLVADGFEVGVHGLYHDGKLYASREIFLARAKAINHYLEDWGSVGFRSPAMHHNLEWLHDLNIQYDMSTFDTDPFEPQPDGVETIFPFIVRDEAGKRSYVELPYTLAQDFTLYVLMRESNIDIWKEKLAWIVAHHGMALLNAHPDYMNFDGINPSIEEYPADYYRDFLLHIGKEYEGQYWLALPRQVSDFVRSSH